MKKFVLFVVLFVILSFPVAYSLGDGNIRADWKSLQSANRKGNPKLYSINTGAGKERIPLVLKIKNPGEIALRRGGGEAEN